MNKVTKFYNSGVLIMINITRFLLKDNVCDMQGFQNKQYTDPLESLLHFKNFVKFILSDFLKRKNSGVLKIDKFHISITYRGSKIRNIMWLFKILFPFQKLRKNQFIKLDKKNLGVLKIDEFNQFSAWKIFSCMQVFKKWAINWFSHIFSRFKNFVKFNSSNFLQ